uniref:C2H2-type domain-containing protein n=1 Tax=Toxocara canis TaxID=6265 RepID=A0A183TY37_TOXCA
LKTDTARKVACRKCAKKVKNEYVKRRQHVLKYHHKSVTDKDMDEVLPDQIRACFPQCLIYSDTQCTECGKEYKSESGRRYHAMRHHLQYMLKCVVHGCTVQEHSPADLKIHIQNDHEVMISNEVNADLFRVFLCEKKKFDAALATEIIRCFPINLRANPPVPATVTDDVGSPALSNIVNAMKSIIMDSMRGEPVEAPLKSRKRQESTSSSSSDGDSRLQRYKGEGNKGGSNSTGPSPTTAGDESARLQHADSQPEKAVPSGDQSPSQTQSPRIAPSQSQMLQTLTVLESESPSSDDDSDYQRYMEAMRNKGRSDVASPSQTSSDNESPCCTAFHSEKAVPPRRAVTIATQSQVLPSTAASSHLQFSSSTTTQPQLRGHLYPTKASTVGGPSPIEPQLYHKRKTLLPLNAVPQQMFMQQSCHAVVGLNCASSSQRSSSTLGFINGPAAFPNSVQLPPMLRGTADRNISFHAGNERNSDERSSRIFHDSSVYGRRGREGWQDGFKPEASGYDQEEKASQPFHFLSEKQQSSRNGRVAAANGRRVLARRSGGSKRGRSARLSKCAKMASGERKRKKTFGGSVYGQQPNRTPIKAPPSGRWRSPKKKGKSTCKKRSSSMNFASNTSDGDMVKSEAGSSASASCRAPKTRCAGKWKRIHISNRSKT